MSQELNHTIIDKLLLGECSDQELVELRETLAQSAAAREQYWDAIQQHVLLEDILRESRGRDLATLENDHPLERESVFTRQAAKPNVFTKRWLLVALAASLLIAAGSIAWHFNSPYGEAMKPEAIASFQSLAGNVQIRSQSGEFMPAASGSTIVRGDSIVVAAEESLAEIMLADGSQIFLDGDSTLGFPVLEKANAPRIHLERGGIQVQAVPLPQDRPMIVTTEQARVTVSGTRFRLYSDSLASRVELNEGSVQFQRQADGQSVEVSEGFFAVASQHTDAQPAAPFTTQPLSQAECQLRHTLLRAGRAIGLTHDGRELATATSRGVQLWNTATGEALGARLKLGQTFPTDLAWTPNDQALVMLSGNGAAMIWQRGAPLGSTINLISKQVRHSAISTDGGTIAQAINTEAGEVAVWRVQAAAATAEFHHSFAVKPWSVAVAKEASGAVAVGRWGGSIQVFDKATEKGAQNFDSEYRLQGTTRPLAISNDGRYVAAFANAQGVVLIDREAATDTLTSQRLLWPSNGARAACLRFSSDGRLLLAGMDDGLVRVWSTSTGELLLVLETGDTRIYGLDLSSDRKTLVTVGRDETVKVWVCEWPVLN